MTKHFDFNLLFWMVKILTSHVTVIVWNSRQKVYISWPQIRRCCFKHCSQFWEEWLAGAGQTNENIKVTDYCIKAPLTQIFVFSEDDRKTKISPLTFKMTKSMVCVSLKVDKKSIHWFGSFESKNFRTISSVYSGHDPFQTTRQFKLQNAFDSCRIYGHSHKHFDGVNVNYLFNTQIFWMQSFGEKRHNTVRTLW